MLDDMQEKMLSCDVIFNFGLGVMFIICIICVICAVYVYKLQRLNFIDTPCRQSYLYVI